MTNSFLKNSLLLILGTIGAQSINIFIQPVLTRIFSVEELGVYTYIISIASVIIPVASLKLDMLIVTVKDDEMVQHITDTCIVVTMFISLILLFVCFITSVFPFENRYGYIIYWVPIIVFTNGIRFIFVSYNNRYKKYKLISVVGFIRELTRGVVQLISGFLMESTVGLFGGYAFAPLFGLKIQATDYINNLKLRRFISIKEIVEIIKLGKKQIFYVVPAQFINSFAAALLSVCIVALFSPLELGYYSVGVRFLDVPIIFITTNISKVIFQKISEVVSRNESVFKIIFKFVFVMICVSGIGFSLIYKFAPIVSELIFGVGYSMAGKYTQCISVMYATRFVATSLSGLFTVFGKQYLELFINLALITVASMTYLIAVELEYTVFEYLRFINVGYSIVYFVMLTAYCVVAIEYDKKIKRGMHNV